MSDFFLAPMGHVFTEAVCFDISTEGNGGASRWTSPIVRGEENPPLLLHIQRAPVRYKENAAPGVIVPLLRLGPRSRLGTLAKRLRGLNPRRTMPRSGAWREPPRLG